MTILMVPVQDWQNPNLPVGDFLSPLDIPEKIAFWEMLSPVDGSGNGHHLKMGGHTFGPQGMVTHDVKGYYADTGILEPDVFTVVVSHYCPTATTIRNVISSLSEIASPFTGHRMALIDTGNLSLAVGKVVGSALIVGANSAQNGWTTYAYTVNNKDAVIQRKNGNSNAGNMAPTDTKAPPKRSMCIAGNPTTDYEGGATTVPFAGIVGCVGIYAGDLGAGGRADLINRAITLMARRGVAA